MGLFTNSFVARGEQGTLLIDAGFPDHENQFRRQTHRLGIRPRDIRLIVVTHGHADHVGSLKALKTQTPAKVAIHRADSDLVRHGIVMVPPPVTVWGRFLCLIFRAFSFLGRFAPVQPEIVIEEEFPLNQFGIPGTIIPTPGHTPGSLSVVLQSGEAFVGDLVVNALPMGLGLGIPALAENVSDIYVSWEKILSAGATTIYPAHGTPFPADKLRKKLRKARGQGSASRGQGSGVGRQQNSE
jgi:hydroxyacylglutathione hydrolase